VVLVEYEDGSTEWVFAEQLCSIGPTSESSVNNLTFRPAGGSPLRLPTPTSTSDAVDIAAADVHSDDEEERDFVIDNNNNSSNGCNNDASASSTIPEGRKKRKKKRRNKSKSASSGDLSHLAAAAMQTSNKKRVTFGLVHARCFSRQLGGSGGVPDEGDFPLGLSWDYM
jgi:hypothetical protein